MTVGGSQQLRLFRIAMRDGATIEDAAAVAGIAIAEARLHAADDAKPPPAGSLCAAWPQFAGSDDDRQHFRRAAAPVD